MAALGESYTRIIACRAMSSERAVSQPNLASKSLRRRNDGYPRTTAELIALCEDSEEKRKSVYSWSALTTYLDNAVARAIYIIPIAGYFILYSDYFDRLFEFTNKLGEHSFLGIYLRISLYYFGSLSLLVAYVMYRTCVPSFIRAKKNLSDYLQAVRSSGDWSEIANVARSLSPAFIEHIPVEYPRAPYRELRNLTPRIAEGERFSMDEPKLVDLFRAYYLWKNESAPIVRRITFAFTAIGYSLFAIPSIELFVRVIGSIAHRLGA